MKTYDKWLEVIRDEGITGYSEVVANMPERLWYQEIFLGSCAPCGIDIEGNAGWRPGVRLCRYPGGVLDGASDHNESTFERWEGYV